MAICLISGLRLETAFWQEPCLEGVSNVLPPSSKTLTAIGIARNVSVPCLWGIRHDWISLQKALWVQERPRGAPVASLVAKVNELEAGFQSLSDEALREKTASWKNQLSAIEDDAELARQLEALLPEAFALVKNACRRMTERKESITVRGHELTWAMIPFDVQLIGGMGLHLGKIAEMATGEGKTLVATMPVYLNALSGRGVHVVTVNDYLAARDSEWMGAVYRFLGLTVGCILHDQPPRVRREQYACDITYGTNAEFGFDYLRDNGMATRAEEQVQRGHYFAIVDEVDSILIDEARTPLIISGPAVHTYDERIRPVEGAGGESRAQSGKALRAFP